MKIINGVISRCKVRAYEPVAVLNMSIKGAVRLAAFDVPGYYKARPFEKVSGYGK
ncbi:MAG: hypothetical protein PHY03_06370 [Dehalococcoidia bacterium]|nr:hypothetical protein [Dehalococcoidia bacterium]